MEKKFAIIINMELIEWDENDDCGRKSVISDESWLTVNADNLQEAKEEFEILKLRNERSETRKW